MKMHEIYNLYYIYCNDKKNVDRIDRNLTKNKFEF